MGKLDGPAEAVLVDDGSKDSSYGLMLDAHAADPRFKVIQLSRNFGHQVAKRKPALSVGNCPPDQFVLPVEQQNHCSHARMPRNIGNDAF